jgi:hypothetical protein
MTAGREGRAALHRMAERRQWAGAAAPVSRVLSGY